MLLFSGSLTLRALPIPMARVAMQKMIPSTLYLPEVASSEMLFIFGRQENVKPFFWLLPGVSYSEAVFAIPNLRLRSDPTRGPFVYWPKLYVSSMLPLLVGDLYGFRKQLTRWQHQAPANGNPGTLTITDPATRAPLVELEYDDQPGVHPVSDYPVLVADALMQQPIISFNRGNALATSFQYQPGDTVQPTRIRARFQCPDLPALPELITGDPIQPQHLGAFVSHQSYRFGLPQVDHLPPVDDPMPPAKPRKVAILGGGVGAITAAYALTEQPDWQQRYEITVYQMGWRLGGKGASGRNADQGQRIEEHGLHLWAGFYDHAFKAFRDCYQELADAGQMDGVFPDWRKAFTTVDRMTMEEQIGGQWYHLDVQWPENDEVPGDHFGTLTPEDYLHMVLEFLKQSFHRPKNALPDALLDSLTGLDHLEHRASELLAASENLAEMVAPKISGIAGDLLHDTEGTALHMAHQLFSRARNSRDPAHRAQAHGLVMDLLDHFQQQLNANAPAHASHDPYLHAWHAGLDLFLAITRGSLAEGVLEHGFPVLNKYDLTDFLKRYGASEIALQCTMVRGGYDYVFGFEHGDIKRPTLAAGVAAFGAIKVFFEYKGAMLWKMNAGMGDTIFTPYYKLLRHRGVKFKFFHRVEELVPDDQMQIASITMQQQATLNPGQDEYDPFVRVGDIDSWPDRPDYNQLVEGEALRRDNIDLESFWSPWRQRPEGQLTLHRGVDFDDVVLGLSVGSFPHVARKLDVHPPWAAMVANVKTTQTMAMQLWTKPSAAELGWGHEHGPVATGYVQSMSTYADMSHLLPQEQWPDGGPDSIAYFCGVLADAEPIPPATDHSFPAQQWQRVRDAGPAWLDDNMGHLWPDGMDASGFDQAKLWTAPAPADTPMADQFFRANIDPSERYVLSQPNCIHYRLGAGESGFDNLYLAGDWVNTAINAGCVEAATMAGLDAAAALFARQQVSVGGKKDSA